MRSRSQVSCGGMDGARMVLGAEGALEDTELRPLGFGGMRQYVPPKCMVRRLRSVRQVQRFESLRKARMLSSSARVMKDGIRERPGTIGFCLSIYFGVGSLERKIWTSSLDCDVEVDTRLGHGRKNSEMALRFLGNTVFSATGVDDIFVSPVLRTNILFVALDKTSNFMDLRAAKTQYPAVQDVIEEELPVFMSS